MDPGETTDKEVKRKKKYSENKYSMDYQQIEPRNLSSNCHRCGK